MKNYIDLNDYEIIYMIGENDEIAKDLMYKKYMPVVNKIAKEMYPYAKKLGLELDDLEQEGYIALVKAMEYYDSSKNVLFYTYVVAAIKRKMLNLVRLNSAVKHQLLNNSISFDETVTEDGSTLFSFLEDKKALKPLELMESNESIKRIKNILFDLDIELASILELRINGFKQNEIATLLDLNRRNITNLLVKLKKNLKLIIEN